MNIRDHYDFLGLAQIKNVIMHLLNGTSAITKMGQVGYDTVSKRMYVHDGTAPRKLLQENDVAAIGRFRGDFSAAPGTIPAGPTLSGDYWRVTTSGTLTGVTPVANLEIGDVLVARIDSPTSGADFFSIQGNLSATSQKFLATFAGNDSAIQFPITHGKATRDLAVQVWNSTGSTWQAEGFTLLMPDVNTVIVVFSAPPLSTETFRVIII